MALIKELRATSGAPITDCKKALEAENDDIDAAYQWLRKRGAAKAAKKAGRIVEHGLVGALALPHEGAIGGYGAAMVEVNSETDFVARNATFQSFVANLTASAAAAVASSGGATPTVEQLMAKPMHVEGASDGRPASDHLAELVGVVGELVTVRRVASLGVTHGTMGLYAHNSVPPPPGAPAAVALGTAVALVPVEVSGAAVAAAVDERVVAMAKRLAMHVVAARPRFLDIASVPADLLERERTVLLDAANESGKLTGKPEAIVEKILGGQLSKLMGEWALLEQAHMVEEGNPKVSKFIATLGKDVGAELAVPSFAMFKCGESE